MVSVDVVGRYPQEEDCTFLKKSKICRICHGNMHNALKFYTINFNLFTSAFIEILTTFYFHNFAGQE